MSMPTPTLEVTPPQELSFVLSAAEATPRVSLTLKHPGTTQEALAFKVKTTQPRRYLVRPNQGLIHPGGTEIVQILLVEKDKNSLMQSYTRLGQAALDHSKDKFLVQSCVVGEGFVQDYGENADEAYDKLSGFWATATSTMAHTIANKKLHVRHSVSESDTPVAKTEMPATHVVAANVQDMNNEQLLNEVNNLRRKYDELVAFSVNLTAERDILNNTLEQTKRDLNRELSKTKMPGGMRNQNNAQIAKASGSSGGGLRSLLMIIVFAISFFILGSRLEAAGKTTSLKTVPVLGSLLKGPALIEIGGAKSSTPKGKPRTSSTSQANQEL